MRRILALLLCTVLLLTGCTGSQPTVSSTFYYRRSTTEFDGTDGIIACENRSITSPLSDPESLLNAYFAGPQDEKLTSPFPRDSAVVRWEMRDDTLLLTMSEQFGALSGVDLSIACACICRTFTELLPVSQIQLKLSEGLLAGKSELVFSPDSFSLYDNGLDQFREEFTVYYTNSQRRYLIAEEISVNLATEDDVVAILVEALMTPPEGSGLYSTLPRQTKLLGYEVENGICTINFSPEFDWNISTECEAQRLTLMSVVNTLTQLEEISQVEFAVGGNLLVSYGNMNITEPFVFDENVIGPVRTGMNEFDVTLYVSNGTEHSLFPVPTRLRQTSGITQAELVVQAILDYQQKNSLYTLIPEGTVLNSVTVHRDICYVDLSREFLGEKHQTYYTARSIAASVCSLTGFNSVQITVDGQILDGEDYDTVFELLTPQPHWFR